MAAQAIDSFSYRALDAGGEERSGNIVAGDEATAIRLLISEGLIPVELRPEFRQAQAGRSLFAAAISTADRIVFLQELGTLLQAGVSVSECLPSMMRAYRDRPLHAAIARLDTDVKAGKRLSESLAGSGMGMPGYVYAIVEAGEVSGKIAQACLDAATQLDHDRKMSQELRNALIYPIILVVTGTAAVFIIFIGVVPKFASLLRGARADVPALSRWVIESGLYAQKHLIEFGIGIGGLAFLLAGLLTNPAIRAAALETASRLPLLGRWLLRREVGRWATVLAALLANKVPMMTALSLSSGTLRLKRMRRDLEQTRREVERGQSLSGILDRYQWFPSTRLNLISVGERSGELPRMLATLGAMETEIARDLQKKVLTVIEPLAILLIGALIGVIMVAVMMAITSLNTVVQ